ncbi:MAG: tRNA (adenosine(37)-N6)-threonylcarbamoyltransferase complex transferase subunit TsaD [Candidatus Kapabacteria bacterium]|nr:tRNA (adenosine(37)-N6)-threonylcarbamoyltransferase complex transferase subunit TsaD [Candidatus Kapabacteria bacterium]
MLVAIESSCDETSVAVLNGTDVLSNIISSQLIHSKWGGVIPELASRAHIESITHVLNAALDEAGIGMGNVHALACTTAPGLAGALLVGTNFAKGLSLKYNIPCVPVNHIEGHLYSGFLEDDTLQFPAVTLVVSGGHTSLFFVESYSSYAILGSTRDDAAGEAFDKTAKMLGLGYPGGPLIDALARQGNPSAIEFPRPLLHSQSFEFSFSGMKTSVRHYLQTHHPDGVPHNMLPDICASLQAAIVDVLVQKTIRAATEYAASGIVIAGGVSANSALRQEMAIAARKKNIHFVAPRASYSLDNAAMIGFVAQKKLQAGDSPSFRRLDFEVNSKALRMHKHGSAART